MAVPRCGLLMYSILPSVVAVTASDTALTLSPPAFSAWALTHLAPKSIVYEPSLNGIQHALNGSAPVHQPRALLNVRAAVEVLSGETRKSVAHAPQEF